MGLDLNWSWVINESGRGRHSEIEPILGKGNNHCPQGLFLDFLKGLTIGLSQILFQKTRALRRDIAMSYE